MDIEKNQIEKSSNQPNKETPKNPKLNDEQTHKKCSNIYSLFNEQKSAQKESFRKQTEILKEGLKKLKELQRVDTNDKEIMKNQEQTALEKPKKNQIYYEDQISHQLSSAAPEVTTIILTKTFKICLYKITNISEIKNKRVSPKRNRRRRKRNIFCCWQRRV